MPDPTEGVTDAPTPSQTLYRVMRPDGSPAGVHEDPALAEQHKAELGDGHTIVEEPVYQPTEVFDVLRSCGELVGRHATLEDARRECDRLNREASNGRTSATTHHPQGQPLDPNGGPVRHNGAQVSYEVSTSRGVVLP